MNLTPAMSSGPERKMDLSVIDKVELGRAYANIAGM